MEVEGGAGEIVAVVDTILGGFGGGLEATQPHDDDLTLGACALQHYIRRVCCLPWSGGTLEHSCRYRLAAFHTPQLRS